MDANRTAVPDRPGGTDLRVDSIPAPAGMGRRSVRDRLVGGLVLALPLLLTLWILGWFYSILEQKVIDPLAGLLLWKLKWTTSSTELPYWFETYAAPIIAVAAALILLYCLDLVADTGLHRAVGWTLRRIPLFSHVYNPIQQIFQSLDGGAEKQTAQRMVLVTFPHPGVKLPAFVTGSCRDLETQKVVLCVYVPTTPVPTSGFFLLVPEEEVTELNWNTEQTLQAVMSGGLACPRDVSYFSFKARPTNIPGPPLVPSEVPKPPPAG
jgi:uncharacterized membrane protein